MPEKTPESNSSQYQKFKDAARELETDDSEDRFDKTLRTIAVPVKAPPAKGEAKKD
jgi:hypothetical protein